MSEADLMKKWDLDRSYSLQLETLCESTSNFQDTRNIKVFTLVDFQLSFFVCGLGVTLCVVILLLISFGPMYVDMFMYIV
jgi:hypothetical protein